LADNDDKSKSWLIERLQPNRYDNTLSLTQLDLMKSSRLLMTQRDHKTKNKPKDAKLRSLNYSGISKPWIEEIAPRIDPKGELIPEQKNLRQLSRDLLEGMIVDSFLPFMRSDAIRLRKQERLKILNNTKMQTEQDCLHHHYERFGPGIKL